MLQILLVTVLFGRATCVCPLGTVCRDDVATDGVTKFSHVSTERQEGTILNTTTAPIETTEVKHEQACVFKCVKNALCNSLNYFYTTKECQLFDVAEYARVGRLIANDTAVHHEVIGICSKQPCRNNGSCTPDNEAGTYTCTCPNARTTGTNCEIVAKFSSLLLGSLASGVKMRTLWTTMADLSTGSSLSDYCEVHTATIGITATQGFYTRVVFVPPTSGKYVFLVGGYAENSIHITTQGKQDRRCIIYTNNGGSAPTIYSEPITLEEGRRVVVERASAVPSSIANTCYPELGVRLPDGTEYPTSAAIPSEYLHAYVMPQL